MQSNLHNLCLHGKNFMSLITFWTLLEGCSLWLHGNWRMPLAHVIQLLGGNSSWLRMVQLKIHLAKLGTKGNVVKAKISCPNSFSPGLQRHLYLHKGYCAWERKEDKGCCCLKAFLFMALCLCIGFVMWDYGTKLLSFKLFTIYVWFSRQLSKSLYK